VLERAHATRDPRFRRLGQHAGIVFRPYETAFPDGGYENVRRRLPDVTRLTELTGWAPQRTLADAVDDLLAERLAGAHPPAARLTFARGCS
jgi:nucleoside-diphosphate-sugar epimerase